MNRKEYSDNPIFSFIVPVYNTADLLPKCIGSLLAQAGFPIEILLIDDGSTDGSYDVCKDYAAKYSFIKAMTKKNEGQGVARNIGIDTAIGEFICFVDSDDWIDPTYCKTILSGFDDPEVDFVNFGLVFESSSGRLIRRMGPSATTEMTGDNIFQQGLIVQGILSSPCNKIFRRRFLVENRLKFPSIRVNEDMMFATRVARVAQKSLLIPNNLYHALVRPSSTSRAMGVGHFLETERLVALEREEFANELQNPVTARYYEARVLRIFTHILFQGAARLKTNEEMNRAFACADRCGLEWLSVSEDALSLLPTKNRIMARATRWRSSFRVGVRFLHWLGIRAH